MATPPMLQSVLLFQHHQATTPNLPHGSPATAAARSDMAKPKDDPTKEEDDPPFDTEENGDNDDDEEGEEKNG